MSTKLVVHRCPRCTKPYLEYLRNGKILEKDHLECDEVKCKYCTWRGTTDKLTKQSLNFKEFMKIREDMAKFKVKNDKKIQSKFK